MATSFDRLHLHEEEYTCAAQRLAWRPRATTISRRAVRGRGGRQRAMRWASRVERGTSWEQSAAQPYWQVGLSSSRPVARARANHSATTRSRSAAIASRATNGVSGRMASSPSGTAGRPRPARALEWCGALIGETRVLELIVDAADHVVHRLDDLRPDLLGRGVGAVPAGGDLVRVGLVALGMLNEQVIGRFLRALLLDHSRHRDLRAGRFDRARFPGYSAGHLQGTGAVSLR